MMHFGRKNSFARTGMFENTLKYDKPIVCRHKTDDAIMLNCNRLLRPNKNDFCWDYINNCRDTKPNKHQTDTKQLWLRLCYVRFSKIDFLE